MQVKICGISDPITLKFLTEHPHSPKFIGFIVNYPKSKRYVDNQEKLEIFFYLMKYRLMRYFPAIGADVKIQLNLLLKIIKQ